MSRDRNILYATEKLIIVRYAKKDVNTIDILVTHDADISSERASVARQPYDANTVPTGIALCEWQSASEKGVHAAYDRTSNVCLS